MQFVINNSARSLMDALLITRDCENELKRLVFMAIKNNEDSLARIAYIVHGCRNANEIIAALNLYEDILTELDKPKVHPFRHAVA